MKLQLLFAPTLLVALVFDLTVRSTIPATLVLVAAFVLSTLPFAIRAAKKDPVVGLLSPAMLALRAFAQVFGVAWGLIDACRKPSRVPTRLTT